MPTIQTAADFESDRRRMQAEFRRRKRADVLRWLSVLLVIGFAAGVAAFVLRGLTDGFELELGWVFVFGIVGSVGAGLLGFLSCYSMGASDLLNVAVGNDPPSPRTAAYRIGAPAAIGGSSWIAVGINHALTWIHWSCLGVTIIAFFACVQLGLTAPAKLRTRELGEQCDEPM